VRVTSRSARNLTFLVKIMQTIAIRLRADRLTNPDLDIRHMLPDMLKEGSGGVISDDGYDYVGDAHDLVLFLRAADSERAAACITEVIARCLFLATTCGKWRSLPSSGRMGITGSTRPTATRSFEYDYGG
jgi:hypothetical protein